MIDASGDSEGKLIRGVDSEGKIIRRIDTEGESMRGMIQIDQGCVPEARSQTRGLSRACRVRDT